VLIWRVMGGEVEHVWHEGVMGECRVGLVQEVEGK
jgi:hypothetical protein